MARSYAPTTLFECLPTGRDIHTRATQILRAGRDANDNCKTLVRATAGRAAVCRTCATSLAQDAQFCGMCGEQAREDELAKSETYRALDARVRTLEREIDRIRTATEPPAPEPVVAPRRVFPHTPAFELLPPRFLRDIAPLPAFLAARGSEPGLELPAAPGHQRWRLFAAALVMSCVCIATAASGCM